jgi:pSer/pThr/pTyr-binding forkhead associated (FHA) protein
LELIDVGSHGGTFVNGKRITRKMFADDGKIAVITDFWPEPNELPASRAHLVERY